MKKAIILIIILFLLGCKKSEKSPCVEALDCDDCNCLFDEMQKNAGNREKMDSLKACYEENCKK